MCESVSTNCSLNQYAWLAPRSPELKIEGTPIYLDVEGLPDRGFYYLIGLRIGNDETAVQHSLWADTIADEGKIWREFLAILETVEKPVLIHYGSYETTFLKEMMKRHGGPGDGTAITVAMKAAENLLSAIFAQFYFPTYSNGLKEIGSYLGCDWSGGKPSGTQTICWRDAWDRTGAPSAKEKLITYNADDCAALGVVCGVVSQLSGVKEKRNGGISGLEVTAVDDQAESSTMWPRFSSAIPGFEAINKAGRWNYQRDRIYIRTDKALQRAARTRALPPTRSLAPSKDETRRGSAFCQVCQKKGVKKGAASRVLYDLRFSKRGIRTWVVRYHYRTFHCVRCHRTFGTPAEFRAGSMYGWNVTGLIMYMLIELGMTQRSIAAALNRIFKLGIIEREVLHLKEWAARFYDATRRQILAVILKGKLVQADETSIIIKGKRVYVWVFTTLREVVYFYAETREASFLQQILTGFGGVLVSDFYAAYDSIPCPQQRCLLHLIRDLNDAALENPFDEGLRGLIMSFATLLKCIVDTIDRRGLKHHFLKRHRADVRAVLPKYGQG